MLSKIIGLFICLSLIFVLLGVADAQWRPDRYGRPSANAQLSSEYMPSSSGENENVEFVGRAYAEGPGRAVFVQDNYAYLGAGSTLVILDVTVFANPVKMGGIVTPGIVRGLYILENYAYVADGDDGLRIIDITDPSYPDEVGVYDTDGYAHGVYVSEGYAYLADGWGLRVIDITNPSNPEKTVRS